jgi:hypothetical protein
MASLEDIITYTHMNSESPAFPRATILLINVEDFAREKNGQNIKLITYLHLVSSRAFIVYLHGAVFDKAFNF